MRLAISNIAWDTAEDAAVALLLGRQGVDAIDIAPGKYFPEPKLAEVAAIVALREWWAERGIEITGMQALLFGATGLNLFGSPESRSAMLARLGAVCRIAGRLRAPRLVFGSPKNRDRSGLSDEEALDRATAFFRELGDMAEAEGVRICLEPNPPRYGCNFMTTTQEAATVVRATGHSAIRLHLDTGTMAVNGEDSAVSIRQNADIVGHVHASEPDLVPLGDGETRHADIARILENSVPDHIVCIEMVATTKEPHLASIGRAIAVARHAYVPEAL